MRSIPEQRIAAQKAVRQPFLYIRQRHKTGCAGQCRKNFCIHIDLLPNTFYNERNDPGNTINDVEENAMRSIPEQRIAEFQEQDYQRYFGISKLEFDRMLKALQEAYRQEHKRKTRFTKISMMDKLILTLIYRYEYRTMESIAKEYEVSLDTIADNIHWVERTLLNADILQTSVTCVYKTN